MRYWPETYAMDVLGTVFEVRSQVAIEHPIVERKLRADMRVVPGTAQHSPEDLGIVDRMLDLGACVVELFSRTPRAQAGFDLPERPDTHLLRLLDTGERYERALAELDAMPEDSRLRKRLVEIMVAWRDEMFDTRQEEEDMLLPESKARYAAWEQRVRGEGKTEGLKEGKKAGLKKGRIEGEQALLRKQLTLRFGTLPADAERRIKRASLAELERWAERVLTAKNLAAVLGD